MITVMRHLDKPKAVEALCRYAFVREANRRGSNMVEDVHLLLTLVGKKCGASMKKWSLEHLLPMLSGKSLQAFATQNVTAKSPVEI